MLGRIKTTLYPAIFFAALFPGISPGILQGAALQESQSRNQERYEKRQRADRNGMYITDQMLEGWLVVKLAARPGLNDVNVEVENGVAVLNGRVATQQDKNRAVWIANSTTGVTSVRDALRVDPSPDYSSLFAKSYETGKSSSTCFLPTCQKLRLGHTRQEMSRFLLSSGLRTHFRRNTPA